MHYSVLKNEKWSQQNLLWHKNNPKQTNGKNNREPRSHTARARTMHSSRPFFTIHLYLCTFDFTYLTAFFSPKYIIYRIYLNSLIQSFSIIDYTQLIKIMTERFFFLWNVSSQTIDTQCLSQHLMSSLMQNVFFKHFGLWHLHQWHCIMNKCPPSMISLKLNPQISCYMMISYSCDKLSHSKWNIFHMQKADFKILK